MNLHNAEEGVFAKDGNIVYATTGYTGFKFMPKLGAIVHTALTGPQGPMRVRL